MRLTVSTKILGDPAYWSKLDPLLQHFLDGRHVWEEDTAYPVDDVDWSQRDEYGRTGHRIVELLKNSATELAYHPGGTMMHAYVRAIVLQPQGEEHIAFSDAVEWLYVPLRVLVENATNDGAFLRAMAAAYQRLDLLKAESDRFWEVAHAGGITQMIPQLEQLCSKWPSYSPRVLVLVDSDARVPKHLGEEAKRIRQFCQDNGIPFHILAKRAIENYIPDSVLSLSPGKAAEAAAACRLTAIQRDHFRMKDGFIRDRAGRHFKHNDTAELFKGVPDDDIEVLKHGFGDHLADLFHTQADKFTVDEVGERCRSTGKHEIKALLIAIEKMI